MSTTSIVSKDNLSTNRIVAEYMTSQSLDVLKKLRFDVGNFCHSKLRYMLMLEKFSCSRYCTLDESQQRLVREDLIRKSILRINEL
jgi:hypothetical protein